MRPLVGDTKLTRDIRRTRRGGLWAIPVVLRRDPPPHLVQPTRRSRPGDEWLDEVAVERAVRDREPVGRPLTWSERLAVARRLLAAGHSANEVAKRTHSNGATLRQLLAAIRED